MLNLDKFISQFTKSQAPTVNQLFEDLKLALPHMEEKDLIVAAGFAGLLARVAYVDMKIQPGELKAMKSQVMSFLNFSESDASIITNLAIENMKELSGIENHTYTNSLKEVLSQDEKYEVLVALFKIAAGDGETSHLESEEIRSISKGLVLSNEHFLSARATVLETLKALK